MKKIIFVLLLCNIFLFNGFGQTASENYALSKNDTLLKKVEIMMWKVCQQVIGEADAANGGTFPISVVEKRHTLAMKCFNDADEYKRRFSSAIFSLGVLDINVTDTNIEGYIGIVFNDLAGVTYEELNP